MLEVYKNLTNLGYDVSFGEYNELKTKNVLLGDTQFSFATFWFIQNSFFAVDFTKTFESRKNAEDSFNSIKDRLSKKYAEYGLPVDGSDEVKYYFEGEETDLKVSMSKKQESSEGGELFYTVGLYYVNSNLLDMYLKQVDDEL